MGYYTARTSAPGMFFLAFAMIVILVAKTEGRCDDAPQGFWKVYPFGTYWDTCSSIYYQNDKTEISAYCDNGSGGSTYNQFSQSKCCITCRDSGDPQPYQYYLTNNNGILNCASPVLPIPVGCPGYKACACKFPFTYNGASYSSCTSAGGSAQPWCEVDQGCAEDKAVIYGTSPKRYWSFAYCHQNAPPSAPLAYRSTDYFPPANPSMPPLKVVSCDGESKLEQTGALMQGISLLRDDPAKAVTGVICWFSDGTQKMLGTSTWFEDNQPFRNDTTNYGYNFGREMFWDANKITGLSASTSKVEHLRLCNVRIQTNAPNGNSLGYDCDGTVVSYDKQLTASSQLISISALVSKASDKLYSLSFTFVDIDSTGVSIEFGELKSSPGPFPSYNVGLMWDNRNSSILSGDISSTISYTTSQKTFFGTAKTVGNAVANSVGGKGTWKWPLVPVPEYDNIHTWENSSTTTNSKSDTLTTTIDFTAKVNVAMGEIRTLSNLVYNGSASLPYKAKLSLGNGLKLKIPGIFNIKGSLTTYAFSEAINITTRTKGKRSKGAVVSTAGYPYSEPLVYSAPYMSVSNGPEPAFVGQAENLCGNMMSVGGMASMKVALAVIENSRTAIFGIRLYSADGTEFCQNLGLLTADPYYKVEVQEFVLQPGETLTGFIILPNNAFKDRLSQLNIITSTGRTVTFGYAVNNNNGMAPYTESISKLGMGSGVLDGLVFTMGPMRYSGMPATSVLMGLGPITLQRYTSMLLKVDKFDPDVPVDLPTRVNTYKLNDLSSTNIKLTWAATTTYDLDKKLKEGWKFENTLKLSLNLPVIPISPTGGKKWTSSGDTQLQNTSSYTSTSSMSVTFNTIFNAKGVQAIADLLIYDQSSTLPISASMIVEFASGKVVIWPMSSTMTAQDGRYAVLRTRDVPGPAKRRALASAATGAESAAALRDEARQMAQRLLALDASDPAKHEALSYHKVTPEDESWEHLSAKVMCHIDILKELNKQSRGEAELPPVQQLVGQRVLVCALL